MGVFPLAAAVVAAVFSLALVRQFQARRRTYQGLWAAALAMYAVASLALFAGVTFGWSPWLYRGYWLFGAVLNVPFLAGGEAELLGKRPWVHRVVVTILAVTTVAAVVVVATAPVAQVAIGGSFPRGAQAFRDGTQALAIARLASYVAYVFLLGGALWSAWTMRGTPSLRARFWGTLLIAFGATIVAGGSAFAATGILIGFSVTLAAGIAVMYLGFLKASSSSAPTRDVAAEPAAQPTP